LVDKYKPLRNIDIEYFFVEDEKESEEEDEIETVSVLKKMYNERKLKVPKVAADLI